MGSYMFTTCSQRKQILTDKKEEIDGSNSIQIYKANNNRQKGRNGQQ